jgi:AAA domain
MTDDVEISIAVADEIVSWRRIFAARKNSVDARDLLRRAAADLWQTLEIDKTVHPESNGVAFQDAVDALHDMAEGSGIEPDDAQRIFAENFKARPSNGNAHEHRDEAEPQAAKKLPPLAWLNMSNWGSEPIPERKWAIKDRVPLNQAGLFSGEGGTGKSIIELTKDVAHVAGKDWFGSLPESGPAFYIGAEDEKDELHRRLAAIARHYGVTFKELIDGGLHVLCKTRSGRNTLRSRQKRQSRNDRILSPALRSRRRH